jgi:membrane associated rhomboid family serine protease
MSDRSGSPVLDLLVAFAFVYATQFLTAFAGLVGALFVLSAPLAENPWTIATSVYAHSGLGHLASNAVALVLFGWPVARAATRVRFHLFFLTTGSIAGVSQILLSDVLATLPVVGGSETAGVLGASGAVFALLGYLLAGNRLSSGLAAAVRVPRWLAWLAFAVVAGGVTLATAEPGVALIAHFTGLFVGLLAGRLGVLNTRPSRSPRST